jgi:hypothetical protein
VLGDRAGVDLRIDDVVVPDAALAGRVGEEGEVEVDRLRADRTGVDVDRHHVRNDILALEVAALERLDDVVGLADRAVVEGAAAGRVIVGERRRRDEVEGEVAAGQEAAAFERFEAHGAGRDRACEAPTRAARAPSGTNVLKTGKR